MARIVARRVGPWQPAGRRVRLGLVCTVTLLALLAAPGGLQEARNALADKRFVEAQALYAQGVADDPAKITQAWGWGMAHYGLGDLDAALSVFERILAADPDHARALYGRALVALRRGGDPRADLERALSLNPDDVRARYRLAQALARRGAHAEAVVEFRAVLARRWIHQAARHALLLALRDAGQTEEARHEAAVFERVERLRPHIRRAEAATRARPDDPATRARLKDLYKRVGRPP